MPEQSDRPTPQSHQHVAHYQRTSETAPAQLEQQEWQAAESARTAGYHVVSEIDPETVQRIVHDDGDRK